MASGKKHMKHYLSFGGGVNSVALYLLMEELGMDFEAVFVNHGGDLPETYAYVRNFIATGRDVTILLPEHTRKRDGKVWNDLYQFCWDREMVPTTSMRWCTGDFKIRPIQRYIDAPCFMHIGIDAGESRRAKINTQKGVENRWLLIEYDIDRDGCKKLITDAGLDVPPKSGCYFCPYQRISQWKRLRREHPDLFCKARKLESRNMAYMHRQGKKAYGLRNDGRTLDRIINDNQLCLFPDITYPPCQCSL